VARPDLIPGINQRGAKAILAEIGVDIDGGRERRRGHERCDPQG
jgi:hypothetical protein